MYKSKARVGWLAAALCMTILTACGRQTTEEADLIDTTEIVATETNFRTTTVRRGTYEEETQSSGVVRYLLTSDLEWDRPGCRYEEINVKIGDHVSEGDVLVRFVSEESLLDLEEMQMQMDRLKEEYQIGIENWEEDIDEAERATWDLTSYAWVRGDIEVHRLTAAYEQYCCDMDHQIETLERSIAKRQEEVDKNVLKAPYDGVIDSVPISDVGSKVPVGVKLVSMHSEKRIVVGADNSRGKFSYNQEVTVSYRDSSFKGRIISASNILPMSYQNDYMVIELDSEEDAAFLAGRRSGTITIHGVTLSVDDTLIAARAAVILSGGSYYVQILGEDGAVHLRPVNIGSVNNNGNGTDVWILEGVDEGETLVLVNG